jgi:hypothetical protein
MPLLLLLPLIKLSVIIITFKLTTLPLAIVLIASGAMRFPCPLSCLGLAFAD